VVNLYIPPSRPTAAEITGTINVYDWGVLPENDSDTNTANLYALRDWCRARPDTMHQIVFPPSEDVYWVNRSDWLRGIRKFKLSGYGAKIGSDDGTFYKQGWHVYTLVVNEGMFYDEAALIASDKSGHHPDYVDMGHLINTAIMGQRTVTLADGGTFSVGDYVLLYGLMQQDDSAPPNPRYFEYNQIRSISGDTLTMEVPLRHTYRDDWPEDETDFYVFNHGRARILNLNRPDFNICERCVIEGIKFVPLVPYSTQTKDNAYLRIAGCLNAVVRDCETEKFIPGLSKTILVENSIIKHYNEQDKIVAQLTYRDCRFSYLNQGWGVEQLTLDGCEVTNFSQANGDTRSYSYARRLRITNCTFLNGTGSPFSLLGLGASVGKEIATIEGNVFHATPDEAYSENNPMRWVGSRWLQELDVVAQTDDGTKTTSVEVIDPGFTALKKIREGDNLIYADGDGSAICRVTKLYEGSQYDDTTKRLALDVETNYILMGGSDPRFAVPTLRTLSIKNNMTYTSDDGTVYGPPDEYFSVTAEENTVCTTLNGASIKSLWVFGYVVEVVFDVIRPYTGSGVNPDYFFEFYHHSRSSTTNFGTATKQTIVRSIDGLPNEPIFEVRMTPRNMAADLPDNDFERPFIKVQVKTVPPRV